MIIGIDPGQSGGIAWVATFDATLFGAVPMPETEADFVQALRDIVHDDGNSSVHPFCLCEAFVEVVHSMPKQGVSSSFKFGQNYGMIRGVLAALQLKRQFVTPQSWQKAMGCLTRGDKNVSKRRAQEMWPTFRVTHRTADAILLAEYGRSLRGADPHPHPGRGDKIGRADD